MVKLYNTLTKKKEFFTPIDKSHVKMYVCGPTVYDMAHIGNARSVVVYDVLFQLLKSYYSKVTYVRNITDIDDKIINTASEKNSSIKSITTYYTKSFHEDMKSLNCVEPTHEPKATENIGCIIKLIEHLLLSNHAYESNKHVYFSIESYPEYGALSGKKIDKLDHGNRVKVGKNKKHPGDFVLWKPANDIDYKLSSHWSSPWGEGRPGWHIECSAMAYAYLGRDFDIHGGGIDLQFPHHENEIAQSKSAFTGSMFARHWVHNGFLTVEEEKMSKSLLNIIKVRDLLDSGIKGEVIRYALFKTHYRKPLDWTGGVIWESQETLNKFYRLLRNINVASIEKSDAEVYKDFIEALKNDLNIPEALVILHEMATKINKMNNEHKKLKLIESFVKSARFIGLLESSYQEWFTACIDHQEIERLINLRKAAKKNKDYDTADRIRDKLKKMKVTISDNEDGTTTW
ncbi:cysteine--tRNA ligase [Wolbachia endosymbiont of Dirofilaria (Dirofilaria) immitis]|uniref:cysteine--tRNA ligase n=1 Tax=Wolbachia endosymbiont of Dirofilaria (Dirofilaria) immitis TaxID=1812115 RepID=UPI00158EDD26|nr:cysteine--tRNA ligase [Wolbachia endosymbiont of Dirofilaria (Dirofilaria) immitis]QKX02101.1 cysteine--tRNA ligase [Wolbachia endosymbiont of Dirofilaria (Dirofilaria) immitis]